MASDGADLAPTSELIIKTSLALFAEKTYAGTSMREIAAAVGVKPASLYNHYASKEDILWEIVQRAWAVLNGMQAEAASNTHSTPERFRTFVRTHTRFHAQEPQLAQITNLLFGSLGRRRYRQVVKMRSDYERTLRDLLRSGRAEGAFNVPDERVTSFAILEVGMGVARWFHEGRGLTLEQLCDVHEALALRMAGYTG